MGYGVGIFGASGYAGGELVRLVDGHPEFRVEVLAGSTSAGLALRDVHPQLSGGDRRLLAMEQAAEHNIDLAILALPHGASAPLAMNLLDRGIPVVDLGSDFRMDTPDRYLEAYGSEHAYPDQLGEWAFGLPELFEESIVGADRVAVPGCYPTSAILALRPLLAAGLVTPKPITIDSMSGASGGGRSAKPNLTFGSIDEGVTAYGVLTHRHRPEIEQGLVVGSQEPTVVFTPHLVPMQRGILSTCHAPMASSGTSAGDLREVLEASYGKSPFVEVIDRPPQTRWVVGSNRCLLWVGVDPRTGTALVLSALDNLIKGAAGQGVQCANLMLGLPETAGLELNGWMP